ncbi:hypothetical protein [Sphingomonas sanguinis]|jgi:hypothetical protein|nr:hypothetical protein [Sphingomonas sanguinis]
MRYDARFEPLEPALPTTALTSLFTTLPALFAEFAIPLPQEDAA